MKIGRLKLRQKNKLQKSKPQIYPKLILTRGVRQEVAASLFLLLYHGHVAVSNYRFRAHLPHNIKHKKNAKVTIIFTIKLTNLYGNKG